LRTSVPDPVLEAIFTTAQRTASWCNSQAWEVILLTDAATDRVRSGFFACATTNPPRFDIQNPQEYSGVYKTRRLECAFGLYESLGIAFGDREASARQVLENFRFFDAPHVAVITTPKALGTYGAVDCGAYVSNLMLAARSHGIASIAQAAVASQSPFFREALGVADDRDVLCGVALGYEDPDHPANRFRTSRAAVSDVVRWIRS